LIHQQAGVVEVTEEEEEEVEAGAGLEAGEEVKEEVDLDSAGEEDNK
jgi:hypothetical protein